MDHPERGLRCTSIRTISGRTLARLGEQIARTPEQFKAWSRNLGHEQVMTTFTSYGAVPHHRQAEIMRNLGAPEGPTPTTEELVQRIEEAVSERIAEK